MVGWAKVGRALIGAWTVLLVAGAARAEEPGAQEAELRAPEIVDPYVEPEPRLVEVVDPYAAPANAALKLDLERTCRNYCLAHRDAMLAPQRRLPPPHQAEEWGSGSSKSETGVDRTLLGGLALGAAALAGTLLVATADSESTDSLAGPILLATATGVGVVVGVALIVDDQNGKTELRIASAAR